MTGGNRGLGKNTVPHLARRGVDVIFAYRSHRAEAEAVADEVEQLGARAVALPLDMANHQTAVNAVAPGAIETDFGDGVVRDNAQLNAAIAAQTALGCVSVPDDIGGVIVALLSDDHRWINGQRIEVSGGMFL